MARRPLAVAILRLFIVQLVSSLKVQTLTSPRAVTTRARPLPSPSTVHGEAETHRLLLESALLSSGPNGDERQAEPLRAILDHFGGTPPSGGSGRDGGQVGSAGRTTRDQPSSSRGRIELPTGWGKTLLSLLTIRAMANGEHGGPPAKVAILVTPFRKLVDQTVAQEAKHNALKGIQSNWLLVVSKSNASIPRTTDVDRIAQHIGDAAPSSLQVIVSTCECRRTSNHSPLHATLAFSSLPASPLSPLAGMHTPVPAALTWPVPNLCLDRRLAAQGGRGSARRKRAGRPRHL